MIMRNVMRLTSECKQQVHSPLIVSIRCYNPAERLPLTDHQKKLYPQVNQEFTDEGYPVLKLKSTRRNPFSVRPKLVRRRSNYVYKMREQSMKEDQDWPSVWPTAKTFVPSAVPLPLRQSYERKPGGVPLSKYANTELVKIANFLHLTPSAIERHCKAIKKFCTKWPEGLDTDEEVRKHFPVTYVTRDYVHSAPTLRDHRARIVELKVHLEDLKLNDEDALKFKLLARERYDEATGIVTITAKACPMRVQNQDYADYLLTAVYYESKDHQEWEKERCDEKAIHQINLDKYRSQVEQQLGLK